jgi:hypothetical protein
MLPKILRMRFFAVSLVSRAGAGAALVARWVCRLCLWSPGEGRGPEICFRLDPGLGRETISGCAKTQKAADSPLGESQLQRLMKPQPINALSALRDGVPCSERLW